MLDDNGTIGFRARTARGGWAAPGAIALVAALLFPASAWTASPQVPPYIGKWYLTFRAVCDGAPEESDGLLTYTAREFIGLENRCRVVRATRRGEKTELRMNCLGEGHPYKTREIVWVADGRLHRRLKDEGKWVTYTYKRCPARKR